MSSIVIFVASLATVCLIARNTGRGRITLADLMIGVFAGFASVGISAFLSNETAEWRWGLPLFFACALAFALEAVPARSPLR
jgi:hypothetical protein